MIDLQGKTVIAIAPHIDDVELGAGGVIYRWSNHCNVYYVGLSFPPLVDHEIFMAEFRESSKILCLNPERIILREYDPRNLFDSRMDILQLFYDLNKEIRPDLVLIPSSYDIHQSHEVVHAEARRAFKYTSILGYELPWNNMETSMDFFVALERQEVDAKVAAINAYKTQKNRLFFSNDILLDLARVRGKQIARDYAECFELIRFIT